MKLVPGLRLGSRGSSPRRGWSPDSVVGRRRSRIVSAGVLLALACAPMPVEGETETPGEPARIVREMFSAEATMRQIVTIDSAAATWRVTCTSMIAQIRCPSNWNAQGVVTRPQIERLFRTVRSSEFRALRKEYDISGTYVDAPLFTLTTTAEGRTRSIRWSIPAPLPAVLWRFDDQVMMTANLPTPDR